MSIITREQAKDLRNAFQCWQQDYDPVEDKEQYDMFGLGMVAMDALLASLEAEAVGEVIEQQSGMMLDGLVISEKPTYRNIKGIHNMKMMPLGTQFYAAPPAAVSVPDDVSGPLAHAYKELTPTFMRNHIDVFERYGIYPDGSAGIQAMRIALDGMNRRAAMLQGAEQTNYRAIVERIAEIVHGKVTDIDLLTVTVKSMKDNLHGRAEPVTTAYKLPPHIFRELVNRLRDTAVKYQGCQQLREQLSRTLQEVIQPVAPQQEETEKPKK